MTVLPDIDPYAMHDLETRGSVVQGHELVVLRRDDRWYVYLNSCPHLGIPLNFIADDFLDLDRQYLICANHGALFRCEDGYCVSGPCVGQRLRQFDSEIRDGRLLVDL